MPCEDVLSRHLGFSRPPLSKSQYPILHWHWPPPSWELIRHCLYPAWPLLSRNVHLLEVAQRRHRGWLFRLCSMRRLVKWQQDRPSALGIPGHDQVLSASSQGFQRWLQLPSYVFKFVNVDPGAAHTLTWQRARTWRIWVYRDPEGNRLEIAVWMKWLDRRRGNSFVCGDRGGEFGGDLKSWRVLADGFWRYDSKTQSGLVAPRVTNQLVEAEDPANC